MAAVFGVIRRRIERVQPRAHRPRKMIARIPTRDFSAVTSGPNNVRVLRIGKREAGLTTAHAVLPPVLLGSAVTGTGKRITGSAHGAVVLHVAVNVVRDLIVGGDVIHLPHG